MAKTIPVILTRQRGAHRLIAQLHSIQIRWHGWRDARQAIKARQKRGH